MSRPRSVGGAGRVGGAERIGGTGPPARSVGNYVLSKTLGEGTFGKVKLGTQLLSTCSAAYLSHLLAVLDLCPQPYFDLAMTVPSPLSRCEPSCSG
jgi:hypothetical protein